MLFYKILKRNRIEYSGFLRNLFIFSHQSVIITLISRSHTFTKILFLYIFLRIIFYLHTVLNFFNIFNLLFRYMYCFWLLFFRDFQIKWKLLIVKIYFLWLILYQTISLYGLMFQGLFWLRNLSLWIFSNSLLNRRRFFIK